jgi:hypothetical protein
LSVHELSQQREALNGKVVRVAGVVKHCQRLSCALEAPDNERYFVSIGKSDAFDRTVQHVLGREIVVEATLDDSCVVDFDHDISPVCGDRSNSLANPVLIWPSTK